MITSGLLDMMPHLLQQAQMVLKIQMTDKVTAHT